MWPPFLEICLFRPFSAFFALFGGSEEHLGNPENALFPQISSDLLKPPSLPKQGFKNSGTFRGVF